ncbi:DUF1364 domain-containing protein [bacterium]|nr:DUF1364 domain-containing protein [bacterium]
MIRSNKLKQSARGEDCTFNVVDVCNYSPETTVLCHIDSEDKGMGIKSHDFFGGFGCSSCHAWLDQHRGSEEDRLFYSLRALNRTWKRWIELGLVTIK